MSLGTWARGQSEHEVILPIVEYDDLDRSHDRAAGEQRAEPQAEPGLSPRSAGEAHAEPDVATMTAALDAMRTAGG